MTTSAKPRKLTSRQERFAELVASGMSATKAYATAGYSAKGRNPQGNASALMENHGVAARIAELRKPVTKKTLLSRDDKRHLLAEIILDESVKMSDRLRAIELDSKLAGHFAPEKLEVETGNRTLASIEERAKRVASVLNRFSVRHSQPDTTTVSCSLSRWKPAVTGSRP